MNPAELLLEAEMERTGICPVCDLAVPEDPPDPMQCEELCDVCGNDQARVVVVRVLRDRRGEDQATQRPERLAHDAFRVDRRMAP